MLAAHNAYELSDALLSSDQAIDSLSADEIRKVTGKYFLMVRDFAAPRADWVAELYQLEKAQVEAESSETETASEVIPEETLDSLWEQINTAIPAWKEKREGVGHASKTMFIHATLKFHSLPHNSEANSDVLKKLLHLLTTKSTNILQILIKRQLRGESLWSAGDTASEAIPEETLSSLWEQVSAEMPEWIKRDAAKCKYESDHIGNVRKLMLIPALRAYNDVDADGSATIEELNQLLVLMRGDIFSFIINVRNTLGKESQHIVEGPEGSGQGMLNKSNVDAQLLKDEVLTQGLAKLREKHKTVRQSACAAWLDWKALSDATTWEEVCDVACNQFAFLSKETFDGSREKPEFDDYEQLQREINQLEHFNLCLSEQAGWLQVLIPETETESPPAEEREFQYAILTGVTLWYDERTPVPGKEASESKSFVGWGNNDVETVSDYPFEKLPESVRILLRNLLEETVSSEE